MQHSVKNIDSFLVCHFQSPAKSLQALTIAISFSGSLGLLNVIFI